MFSPLLNTKLYLPPPRPGAVARPRLLHKLNAALRSGSRLVLVSAPAGFGKTTLLSAWIESHTHGEPQTQAEFENLKFAWLSLDEADNDPQRFWRYLLAAIQKSAPQVGQDLLASFQAAQAPDIDGLVAALLNDLSVLPGELCLVCDDYHLIENAAIQSDLNFFINRLPPQIHLVLLTRSDPPLQLARRRGRGELAELRAADLRFTLPEITQFFNEMMHLGIHPEDLEALETRTEGWIAGMQLAALSLQEREDLHEFVAAFAGDDRYIADYLVEEVLQRQPENIRAFLLRTSILERLSAPLCDTLASTQPSPGSYPLSSSQATLDTLERSNLFLIPLDNRREWFRYHHLFARLLRQNLAQTVPPEEIAALYLRASEWHAQNGFLVEAVDYALAGGDYSRALALIDQVVVEMFMRSELTTLVRWAQTFPRQTLAGIPRLCVALAWAATATNAPQMADALVCLVENRVGVNVAQFLGMDPTAHQGLPPETLGALVELTVLRTRLALDDGQMEAILSHYSKVLPYLTAERSQEPYIYNLPLVLRPPMIFMLGTAYRYQGKLAEAEQSLAEAVEQSHALSNHHIVSLGMGHLGQVQSLRGGLETARRTYLQALAYQAQLAAQGQFSNFFSLAQVGMGALAYERGDLEAAQTYLYEGVRLGRVWNSWEVLAPGFITLGLLALAQGDQAKVESAIADLERLACTCPPWAVPVVGAYRAWLELRLGRVEAAAAWAGSQEKLAPSQAANLPDPQPFVLARLALAQGNPARAQALVQALVMAAEDRKEWGRAIPALVLQALAYQALGRLEEAIGAIERAASLAAGEHYLRTFVDEGPTVHDLLLAARQGFPSLEAAPEGAPVVDYLDSLLQAFPASRAEPPRPPAQPAAQSRPAQYGTAPVESLSEREQEVLLRMATGATNSEIAQEFYISVNTVKKHVNSIFGKLGATNRIQAVEFARRLGLL